MRSSTQTTRGDATLRAALVIGLAWGCTVSVLAAGLGAGLDDIREVHERVPAARDYQTPLGTIAAGPGTRLEMLSFVAAIPGGNDPVTSAQITVGSPVRVNEVMEYSLYTDATDGKSYLGAQSISTPGSTRQPVLGPLDPNGGFTLTYLDRDGNQIACGAPCNGGFGSADMQARRRVRAVRVGVVAVSDENVNRAGYSGNQQLRDSVVTLVSLRNAAHR